MISDTLHEASEEIREYLTEPPYTDAPADLRAQIDAVLAAMDALRQRLDAPPTE